MWKTAFRVITTMLFLLLAYLIQACLIPYLKIGGVQPNIIFGYIAVITVLYGSWYSVATGVFAGLLVETLLSALPVVNAVAYPALAFAAAQFLAYKPERAMKPAKSARAEKLQKLYTPFLRVLIGAAFMTLLYEIIFIVFYFLSGIPITFTHVFKALGAVLYTVACTVIIYFILWRILGFAGNRGFLSRIAEGGTFSELFRRAPKTDENEEAAKAAQFTRYTRERNTAEGGRRSTQSDIPAGRYSRKSRRRGDESVKKPRFRDEYSEEDEKDAGGAEKVSAESKDSISREGADEKEASKEENAAESTEAVADTHEGVKEDSAAEQTEESSDEAEASETGDNAEAEGTDDNKETKGLSDEAEAMTGSESGTESELSPESLSESESNDSDSFADEIAADESADKNPARSGNENEPE